MEGTHFLTLRDGRQVAVRPIEPEDQEALLRAFERLSEESRYRRFLSPMPTLAPSMLRYLTEVDHRDHEALVALEAGSGELVGVARYVRGEGPGGEAAVTVADEWQGAGLGTALTSMLAARALEEGVDRFRATLLADNAEMLDLLASVGSVEITGRAGGTLQVEVPLRLEHPGAGKGLYGVLRTVAGRAAELARPPWGAQ